MLTAPQEFLGRPPNADAFTKELFGDAAGSSSTFKICLSLWVELPLHGPFENFLRGSVALLCHLVTLTAALSKPRCVDQEMLFLI